MNKTSTCNQCGAALDADTHAGLCPSCLLQVGVDVITPPVSSSKTALEIPTLEDLPRSFGDYELLERIAHGGMGVVYKARQISLNRMAAVKMILAGELASKETILRFRAEAESAAGLRHPNIVPIFETGEIEGQHYFSMEYIEGRNLAERVAESPLPAKQAARYLQKVAEALEYAHQKGVLHRDLKPSNVLIDERDEPRVTDFGLAKKLTYDSAMTLSGQLIGSPNFMPPEQASSKRGKVGRLSDVYGLGALLYHLLTGRPPFQAPSLEETLSQVFDQEPVSPIALNPGVSRDLETICLKCLEKESAKRYSSAGAVADELGRFLQDEPIQARSVGWTGKALRWCRRKPVIASLAAAVMLLLLTLAIGGPIVAARQTALAKNNRALAEGNRRVSYNSDLTTAWHAWNIGNIDRCNALLARHQPQPGQEDLREFTWRYLQNLGRPPKEVLSLENPHEVFFSAVSHDGNRLAVTGASGNVTVWNVKECRIENRFNTGPTTPEPGGIDFSPDGRLLVTTGGHRVFGAPGMLHVWDAVTAASDPIIEKPGGYPGKFSPDGKWFALGSREHEIVVRDVIHGWKEVRRWKAHDAAIWEIHWSRDGTQLITASDDHLAIIWDAESGVSLGELKGHEGPVMSAQFSPVDANIVATTSKDKTIRFWDASTFTELASARYEHTVEPSNCLAWSRDGRWVASASHDGLVKLRDWKTQSDWTLRGHGQSVMNIRFALDSNVLITASLDGLMQVWDLDHLPPNDVLEGKANHQSSSPMAFSPDSRTMATVDANGTEVILWDAATGTPRSRTPIDTSKLARLLSVADTAISLVVIQELIFISMDRIATACSIRLATSDPPKWHHKIVLMDLEGQVLDAFSGKAPIRVSPDGAHLAFRSEGPNTKLQFRHLSTGRQWPEEIEGYTMQSNADVALAFSPDGNRVAVSGRTTFDRSGPNVFLLDVVTGRLLARFKRSTGRSTPIRDMAFTPDGRWLIASGFDPRIQVWDVQKREPAYELKGHTAHILSLAVSPDGKTLVTGSWSGVLKFWSLEQQSELLTLRAHKRSIYGLAFSRDGNTLASGGIEGKVRLWRAVPKR